MNKYLIVLMAICLVSVHAHVKRDAPATAPENQTYRNDFQRQLHVISKTVGDKFKEAFNPDEMKKNLNAFDATLKAHFKEKNKE